MGVRIYTMRDIDERGMKAVMDEVRKNIIDPYDGVHVSFDMDCIDPQYAPGVSTPVTGGLSYREAHLGLEMIADTHKLLAMDIVELNPLEDAKQASAKLAVELIQSLLGKNIL
jgi:arginase